MLQPYQTTFALSSSKKRYYGLIHAPNRNLHNKNMQLTKMGAYYPFNAYEFSPTSDQLDTLWESGHICTNKVVIHISKPSKFSSILISIHFLVKRAGPYYSIRFLLSLSIHYSTFHNGTSFQRRCSLELLVPRALLSNSYISLHCSSGPSCCLSGNSIHHWCLYFGCRLRLGLLWLQLRKMCRSSCCSRTWWRLWLWRCPTQW